MSKSDINTFPLIPEKERAVLSLFLSNAKKMLPPPTAKEVGASIGKGETTAAYYINKLARLGYLESPNGDGRSRGYVPAKKRTVPVYSEFGTETSEKVTIDNFMFIAPPSHAIRVDNKLSIIHKTHTLCGVNPINVEVVVKGTKEGLGSLLRRKLEHFEFGKKCPYKFTSKGCGIVVGEITSFAL